MPLKAITFGVLASGKTILLAGAEIPVNEQAKAFAKYKAGEMPKECVLCEMWDADRGRLRRAVKPVAPAAVTTEPPAPPSADQNPNPDPEPPETQSPEPDQNPENDFVEESAPKPKPKRARSR